jgi:hypothetical protein
MDNDEYDVCYECGCEDFHQDVCTWERSCMGCGLVSCYEWSDPFNPNTQEKFYKHANYFMNTVLMQAIKKGAPIGNQQQEKIHIMFQQSVRHFFKCRNQLRRKNYPSYQYALLMIGKSIGMDLSNYIKLPKMAATMQNVIHDWQYIDPTQV